MADDGSGNDYDREYYRWYIRIGVFTSYFPIVIYNIFPIYAGSFFATYSGNTADNVYNNITNYLSPVWVGLRGMADINSGRETQIKYMMILLL